MVVGSTEFLERMFIAKVMLCLLPLLQTNEHLARLSAFTAQRKSSPANIAQKTFDGPCTRPKILCQCLETRE